MTNRGPFKGPSSYHVLWAWSLIGDELLLHAPYPEGSAQYFLTTRLEESHKVSLCFMLFKFIEAHEKKLKMFKKVLVATDMLEACDAAVLTALEIAKQNNGEFYILHVLESASTIYRQFVKHFKTGEKIVSDEAYEETVKKEIEKKCAGALKPYGKYEIKVSAGFPWEKILKWTREKRADLVVLGPHSRRAEEKGVARTSGTIGSTIEGVVMRER